MTGAGAASVAFVPGDGFDSIPGSPTFYSPGHNIQVSELSLDNALQRLRTPDNANAVDSIAGNFEGAVTLSWTMSATTHSNVRDAIFNGSNTHFVSGLAQTSRWYLSADYLDTSFASNVVEAELRSCIPLQYQVQYQQGTNTVRETLTMAYADLRKNTSETPTTIEGPAVGDDAPFYGMTLTIGGDAVNREQGVTLDVQGPIYRYHRGSDRNPSSAILANPQTELTSTVIYHTDDYLGISLGGDTSDTQPQNDLNNKSGTLVFDEQDGTEIANFSLPSMKVNQWQGQDLVAADADFQGQASWHVNGNVSVS